MPIFETVRNVLIGEPLRWFSIAARLSIIRAIFYSICDDADAEELHTALRKLQTMLTEAVPFSAMAARLGALACIVVVLSRGRDGTIGSDSAIHLNGDDPMLRTIAESLADAIKRRIEQFACPS